MGADFKTRRDRAASARAIRGIFLGGGTGFVPGEVTGDRAEPRARRETDRTGHRAQGGADHGATGGTRAC
jgi:hypothetical protein